MATNAVYKVYNGSSWVEYYFKTSAAQVGVTSARKFVTTSTKVNGVAYTLDSSGDGATVTINGTHITGSAAAPSGYTLQYVGTSDTIAAALGKLDKAAKEAKDAIPSGVLTASNYSSTLGSVYQPLDADLTAIAGLSGSYGFLKKTASNTWTLDQDTYVPTSRTVNSKALSSNITLTASDIDYNDGGMSVGTMIELLNDRIEAFARGWVLSYAATSSSTIVNSSFNSNAADITLAASSTIKFQQIGEESLDMLPLKIGDIFYVKEVDVPDRWVSAIDTSNHTITLSKLETSKVDLSNYATKGTTLSHYGITDAKISGGVITLGSNTITPLTSHQDISGKAPNNHASSATTYGVGTSSNYGHVKLVSGDLNGKSASDGYAASQSHTHSQYLTAHQSLSGYATQTWVDTNFARCTAGTSTPSSPSTGDIWIDTNN